MPGDAVPGKSLQNRSVKRILYSQAFIKELNGVQGVGSSNLLIPTRKFYPTKKGNQEFGFLFLVYRLGVLCAVL